MQKGHRNPVSGRDRELIRDVWSDNLEEEFKRIRELVVDYPYIGTDTEFPGVVGHPSGKFKSPAEYYFLCIVKNVNYSKIIQLGISLFNERGEVPVGVCTWQFNFMFDLATDRYAIDSVNLLKNSGLDFDMFRDRGIDPGHFAALMYSSGLVLNPEVAWIGFHAGYDFGYLLKVLLNREVPETTEEFHRILNTVFPFVIDIRYVLRQFTDITLNVSLDYLAEILELRRRGTAHQAGSDSLLTGHCYFKMLRDKLKGKLPNEAKGVLCGLSKDAGATSTPMSSGSMMSGSPNGFQSASLN